MIVYAVLPLAIWITVQIAFILTGVYFPFYGQRILASKWKRRSLHVFALVLGLLFPLPTIIVSSTKGHSLFGPTFPPVVCTSQRRDIMIFTWLIPVNVLLAVIITMLIFIFYKVIKVRTFQINDNNNSHVFIVGDVGDKVFIIRIIYFSGFISGEPGSAFACRPPPSPRNWFSLWGCPLWSFIYSP